MQEVNVSVSQICSFIVLVAMHFQIISACTRRSRHCPCDEKAWSKRTKEFGCEKRNYTCILTEKDELIETCIAPYQISRKEDGCPYVKTFFEGFGPQIGGKLSSCDVTGCPPTNHSAYYITELYKYPACWIPMRVRADKAPSFDFSLLCLTNADIESPVQTGNSSSKTANVQNQNLQTLHIIVIVTVACITIVTASAGVIVWRRRRHKQRQETDPTTQNQLLDHKP